MSTPPPAWPDVLVAWCAAIADSTDADTTSIAPHAADFLESLDERRTLALAAIERFGRALGAEGWPLDPIAGWLRLLALIAPHHAPVLAGFDAGSAVSRGWATGFVDGSENSAVIDPVTGLCTPAVLKVRLREVYDHCAALGIDPRAAYALGVIDLGHRTSLEHCAEGAVVGLIVWSVFTSGETLVALDGRVVVLAPHTPRLPLGLRAVEQACAADPLLGHSPPVTWIEDLPSSTDQLDRYLTDIAR